MTDAHDKLLIVDFGSQVTQLIARRVREAGVYCEIVPFQKARRGASAPCKPKAVILSGGPATVPDEGSPRAPRHRVRIRRAGARHLLRPDDDGRPARRRGRERPPPRIRPRRSRGARRRARCSTAVWAPGEQHVVWMSHGDRITALPPGFARVGDLAERALRRDRRREAALLRPDVPPRGRPYAGRRAAAPQFRPRRRRPQARLDDGRLPRARRARRSAPRSARRA